MGSDVSEAVYVCLEEVGLMFGYFYGFGSFLVLSRGVIVVLEFEVFFLVVYVEGEKSKGSKFGVFEEE